MTSLLLEPSTVTWCFYRTLSAVTAEQEAQMTTIFRNLAITCGMAGVLAVSTLPTSAQVVVVDPYYGGPRYAAPYGAYGGYAYAPGYRSWRYQNEPAGYDSTGQSYSWRELGWQPGAPGGAPANPCWPSQRTHNLC